MDEDEEDWNRELDAALATIRNRRKRWSVVIGLLLLLCAIGAIGACSMRQLADPPPAVALHAAGAV